MQNELEELLQVVPEWTRFLEASRQAHTIDDTTRAPSQVKLSPLFLLFERLGPKAIYSAALSVSEKREILLKLVRDYYLLTLAQELLPRNATLRRFFQERRLDRESQRGHITSIAADLAFKLDDALRKKIAERDDNGYKVLLKAYVQASSGNAVIDFIRMESQWEKQTLKDQNLDDDELDPRDSLADDISYSPENIVLSKEKVKYLNEFRDVLKELFAKSDKAEPSLLAIDLTFGLGLSPHSKIGVEMTMRECCDKLKIEGETQARKIARCQVLLDKGLDQVRNLVRERLPVVAAYRQQQININTASRRDLRHQLGLTEGEVERLVANRQFKSLDQLAEMSILKSPRLPELVEKGAAAVPVPVDLNTATLRDMIDILVLAQESAQKLVASRPYASIDAVREAKLLPEAELSRLTANGAIIRPVNVSSHKINVNFAELEQLVKAGLSDELGRRLLLGRPYKTWQELDQYLGLEDAPWQQLRKNFVLSEISS